MALSTFLAILATLVPILHLLGLASAIEVLLYARSSQGAIAWCIFLVIFPVLGLPFYWTLGRSKFVGYRERIARVLAHQQHNVEWYKQQIRDNSVMPPDAEAGRAETFSRIAGTQFVGGNSVQLLIDGQATFDAIFAEIDKAVSYILVEFFIVKDDEIGTEFKERLIAAAKRGVRVLLIYDEIGSHDLPARYIAALREGGVHVTQFGTRKGGIRNFFQVNFRNHRKIVLVDGQTGFIGGHNVGDEYLGRDPAFGHWRDTHVRVSGPGVIHFKGLFSSDWVWATGAAPDVATLPAKPVGSMPMVTIASGPADNMDRCLLFFLHCISSARSRVWIASPYFIPDDAILAALRLAAMRGVDVRIILPAKKDHLLVWLASFFFVPEATSRGVKVFRYRDGFLHQKVAVIDDLYASVGSANLDNRSFRLNFETTSLIADRDFNAQVAEMLERDIAQCEDVSHQAEDSLPFWKRIGSRIARLFSPVL